MPLTSSWIVPNGASASSCVGVASDSGSAPSRQIPVVSTATNSACVGSSATQAPAPRPIGTRRIGRPARPPSTGCSSIWTSIAVIGRHDRIELAGDRAAKAAETNDLRAELDRRAGQRMQLTRNRIDREEVQTRLRHVDRQDQVDGLPTQRHGVANLDEVRPGEGRYAARSRHRGRRSRDQRCRRHPGPG